MKTLKKTFGQLQEEKRWDIDYHTPAELINGFRTDIVRTVDEVATVVTRGNRNPLNEPDTEFQYVDIGAIDVTEGAIIEAKPTIGSDAPSRARKVVKAFDILVSTVRPTRGAVAIVPIDLHDEIASTGYSVVRAKEGINPFYLHFVLRLGSTREQFRKWSTGSSYPAILDSDVKKTRIPVPTPEIQDEIAMQILRVTRERHESISKANALWEARLAELTGRLKEQDLEHVEKELLSEDFDHEDDDRLSTKAPLWDGIPTIKSIDAVRKELDILK